MTLQERARCLFLLQELFRPFDVTVGVMISYEGPKPGFVYRFVGPKGRIWDDPALSGMHRIGQRTLYVTSEEIDHGRV